MVVKPPATRWILILLFSLLTAVYPHLASAGTAECLAVYHPSSQSFKNLIRDYFADGDGTPKALRSAANRLWNTQDRFRQFHAEMPNEVKLRFRTAIQESYFEATKSKNSGQLFNDTIFKRLMDGFLNLELDRVLPNVKTVDDLKSTFQKMNQLLGRDQAINFDSVLKIGRHLQRKMQRTSPLLNYLKTELVKKSSEGQDVTNLEKLIADIETAGTLAGSKIVMYGSAVEGRGLKGVSDLDFSLPETMELDTVAYFEFTSNPRLLEITGVSHLSGKGRNPLEWAPSEFLQRARWLIEVTPDEISFHVYDAQTNTMRKLLPNP